MAGGAGLSKRQHSAGGLNNRLRIVGGRWRGRKLAFPDAEGLRPTPDRVRETLFNWLQNDIVGARCLDLFAGSGALGLEALSRGAASATLVDSHANVAQQLQTNLEILQANNGKVVRANAQDFLSQLPSQPFDIVFLDPPFHKDLLVPCCQQLEACGWLASPALIYAEAERDLQLSGIPESWQLLKELHTGQVSCRLFLRRTAD